LQTVRVKELDETGKAVADFINQSIRGSVTLADLLRKPGFHYGNLGQFGLSDERLDRAEREGAEIDIKYAGYIQRQQIQIEQTAKQEHRQLPADLNYYDVVTLSKESQEKLTQVRPVTIGQAGRIGGVNPADINALLIYLEIQVRASKLANNSRLNPDFQAVG
jgi:tRNA uridine 5-carboxymethylaminomethyl modification enzyme